MLYDNKHQISSLTASRLRDKTREETFGLRDQLRNSYLDNEIGELAKLVDLLALVLGLISRLKVNGSKEGKYYLCVFLTPGFIRKITCYWRKLKIMS